MIQILPIIVGDGSKGIAFESYAPFFKDFDDDNEDPITFAIKVEDQFLPKFAEEEYLLQRFSVEEFPDTDLKDNLIDHLKSEFATLKKEIHENKIEQKTFDVPVKHFMINLSYLQTSRLLQSYYKGNEELGTKQGELTDRAYITEQLFTQTLYDVNNKYGQSIDEQETMKDILDYIFFHGTRKYIIW